MYKLKSIYLTIIPIISYGVVKWFFNSEYIITNLDGLTF